MLNYFSCLCFIWAAVGLGSRLLIVCLGERWKDWEEHSAYSESRPKWLYAADLLAAAVVAFTWYMVWKTEITGAWIAALLLSLVLIKVCAQMYRYNSFRRFIQRVLGDRKLFRAVNWSVGGFSAVVLALGVYYMLQLRPV